MASSSRNTTSRPSSPSHRSSRVADAIQVAPYLTHVVRHHGQITLIPPENTARIRKAKKKRPALRAEHSTGSADLPRARTPISRSRPQTPRPRPHSAIPTRSAPYHVNGLGSSSANGSRNTGSRDDTCIPDFPPPSFEEAMLAAPSPNNSTPGAQTCDAPRMESPHEPPVTQDTAPSSHVAPTNPSEPPPSPDTESLRSESSHSSLEESIQNGPRSLWEQDREAGFSLDERVQRELERRRLADSLPRAPPTRRTTEDSTSVEAEEAGSENGQRQNEIDDVLLVIQEKYRAQRRREELHRERSSASTSRVTGGAPFVIVPVASSSRTAASLPQPDVDLLGLGEPNRPAASRKGKEKEGLREDSSSPSDSSYRPSPSRTSSESALSRVCDIHNAPLRPQVNTSTTNADSTITSTSRIPASSDDPTFAARSTESSSSFDTMSHTASTSTPNIFCNSSSEDNVSIPSQPSADDSDQRQPITISSPPLAPHSSSPTYQQPSSSNRPLPVPPVASPITPTSTSSPEIRHLPTFTRRTGVSVRDRISAFEALQNRPIPPPPPPTRPVIRRLPPPVPGPSNLDRMRSAFDTQTEDVRHSFVESGTQTTLQQTSEDAPTLPPRRRPPPPVPPHRRQRSVTSSSTQADLVPTARPSSSSSIHLEENDSVVPPPTCITTDSSSPAEPSITDEAEVTTERLAAAEAVGQPVDSLEGDIAQHDVVPAPPLDEITITAPSADLESLSASAPDSASNDIVVIPPDDLPRETHQGNGVSEGPEQVVLQSVPLLPNSAEGETLNDLGEVEENSSASAAVEVEEHHADATPSDQLVSSEETSTEHNGHLDAIEGRSAAPQPLRPLQPMFTGLTDLDLLLARLEDPDFTFSGRSYDDLLLLEEIMGPALGTASVNRPNFEEIPLGRVEVLRRRITKDGRTKLKLALLGVSVDKCGICLVQFKDGIFACLLPCRHAFHENCLRLWMRRGDTCPLCRGPLTDVG